MQQLEAGTGKSRRPFQGKFLALMSACRSFLPSKVLGSVLPARELCPFAWKPGLIQLWWLRGEAQALCPWAEAPSAIFPNVSKRNFLAFQERVRGLSSERVNDSGGN